MTANFFMMEIKNRIKIIEINETMCVIYMNENKSVDDLTFDSKENPS